MLTPISQKPSLLVNSLGLVPYQEAWELQKQLHQARIEGRILDTLLLLQHPPVLTLGRGSRPENILSCQAELKARGVELFEVERGGDVTFHGPGQLVGYPIMDLEPLGRDLHRYLRNLEEVLILTLQEYNIAAQRRKNYTGVWVGEEKIASIGIHVSRWVTRHGFALNVTTDLTYFDLIVPCGIPEVQMTSIEKILGRKIDWESLEENVADYFGEIFQREAKKAFNLETMKPETL